MIEQNAFVRIQTYPINRIFCWHSRRHLRRLGTSNGAAIYCGKCFRNRFGYIVTSQQSAES